LAGGALHLLEAFVDVQGLLLELLLPLLLRGLEAVAAEEVGLVLLLALLQGGGGGGQLLLAAAQLLLAPGQLAPRLLLLGGHQAELLVEELPVALQLLAPALDGGQALGQLLMPPRQLGVALVEAALALLGPAGGAAGGDPAGARAGAGRAGGEGVAALAVAAHQLGADLAQLAAQAERLLVLAGRLGAGVGRRAASVDLVAQGALAVFQVGAGGGEVLLLLAEAQAQVAQ